MNQTCLTNLSTAGGCGCKQDQGALMKVLTAVKQNYVDPAVVVNFNHSDDCAVYDLNSSDYSLVTTDFFTPIVDDPYIYGIVAAANALSDVYAMGGRPILANAIFGYPREHLKVEALKEILRGGAETLDKAKCSIVGGHTIENQQPFYGFTVFGIVSKKNLKKNIGAKEGDLLVLTKPIGIGIYANSLRLGLLTQRLYDVMIPYLTKVNHEGYNLGYVSGVNSMTDLTGFGLVGHAIEMCQESSLGIDLEFDKIGMLPEVKKLVTAVSSPHSGLMKNYQNYKDQVLDKTGMNSLEDILPLFDPQSNGGLLIAVDPNDLEIVLNTSGSGAKVIGRFMKRVKEQPRLIVRR